MQKSAKLADNSSFGRVLADFRVTDVCQKCVILSYFCCVEHFILAYCKYTKLYRRHNANTLLIDILAIAQR